MRMYQDQENRAYSHILTTLFPEQTKTLPRIIVWSVIFLVDLILVFWGCYRYGLLEMLFERRILTVIPFAATFGLFWLQGYLWGIFRKLKGE